MIESNAWTRAAFVAGGAALALAPRAVHAASQDLAVIRAGTIPTDVSANLAYAKELGYFKDAGLDVAIQPFQSGPVIVQAVLGGSLDIGSANVASIAAARESGLPLQLFAPASVSGPASTIDPVMVRKDSPIKTVADLNNKTVAIIATKTMQHAAFLLWVDKHGGDSKSIKFIEIPNSSMIDALDAGRVDAGMPSSVFISQGLKKNRVLGNVYASMPSTILVFGYFAADAWLQAHPDLALKFAAAIKRASIWANSHQQESAVILAKFAGIDLAVANTMGRSVYATALDPAEVQPVLDNGVRYDMLPHPMSASELIWKPLAK